MVPEADVRTYYDQPILHQPVWTAEIPWYFFTGGLAGASSVLALASRLTGDERLAATLERVALGAVVVSPALLVSDLGRPERFYNMLRVFKPTSPMSVGSWILAVYSPAAGAAAVLDALRWLPGLRGVARVVAAVTGPGLVTYTGVLLADTAVPVWHEARAQLPFVSAGSALASAGAAGMAFAGTADAGPARRALVAGAAMELAAIELMKRRLGSTGEPYRSGVAGRYARATKLLTGAGMVAALTAGRRRRAVAVVAGAAVLAGSVCQRFAVYKAGFASAADPRYTVAAQRRRSESGSGAGAGLAPSNSTQ